VQVLVDLRHHRRNLMFIRPTVSRIPRHGGAGRLPGPGARRAVLARGAVLAFRGQPVVPGWSTSSPSIVMWMSSETTSLPSRIALKLRPKSFRLIVVVAP
jgi:hypothetical protein